MQPGINTKSCFEPCGSLHPRVPLLLPQQAVRQLPSCWQHSLLFFHLSSHRIFNGLSTAAFSFINSRTTTNFLTVTQPQTVEWQKGNCFSLQPFHDSLQVVAGSPVLKDCRLKATALSKLHMEITSGNVSGWEGVSHQIQQAAAFHRDTRGNKKLPKLQWEF